MTNPYGYHHKIREELVDNSLVDPNRDFPYFSNLSESTYFSN